MILWTFRARARPTLELIEDESDLPLEVIEHWDAVCEELIQLGFAVEQTMFLSQMIAGVQAYLQLYVQEPKQDLALIVSAYAVSDGQRALKSQYVEFSSRGSAGRVLNTRNNRIVGAFPIAPNATSLIFYRAGSVAQIYAAHQSVWNAGDAQAKVLRLHDQFSGDARALIAAGILDEFEYATSVGYLRYIASPRVENEPSGINPYRPVQIPDEPGYVPTLRGAYMMTWNEIWPFKALNLLRHVHRSERIMREAGVRL